MSARSDKASSGMALSLGICILNIIVAIHYHSQSDAYLLNVGAAVFSGFFFFFHLFGYIDAKIEEDIERTYRHLSGK
jgi:hypothetical protein